jgi:VRR-NUC domain
MTGLPPLLVLAEGRKPRARRAPRTAPKEYRLQTDVADVLKDHALPTWRWSHVPAGERRDVRTGARLKRMGLQKGWPDIVLINPAGIFHALELKRVGEDLSEDQDQFQLWAIRHGVPHSVAYSLDEAFAALNAWGCLRIKIGGTP